MKATPELLAKALAQLDAPFDKDHDTFCEDGWVVLTPGTVARCPVCKKEAEHARFQQQLEDAGMHEYHDLTWDDLTYTVPPFQELRDSSTRLAQIRQAGHNLLMHGPPGTGKTQAGVLLLRTALQNGMTGLVINLGFASMEIRHGYGRDDGKTEAGVVNQAREVDYLLIDDVGANETGNAAIEKRILYAILEYRMTRKRPVIITTNLQPQELARTIGGRLLNRLQPLRLMDFNHGTNFRVDGKSRDVW